MSETNAWFTEATGGRTARRVAAETGIAHSTISRWLREGVIPLEHVIAIARVYDVDRFEAMQRCGYLTADELVAHRAVRAVAEAPTVDLAFEVFRRQVVSEP